MQPRTMLSLPPIAGACECALPLCDATAMAIATVAVDERNVGPLAAALAADPAFAIWSVCALADSQAAEPPLTIDSLTNWIARRLLDLLQWPGSPIVTFSPEQNSQFAALVAESVATAREAARAAAANDLAAEPRYLAALTSRSSDWLTAVGSEAKAVAPIQPPLEASIIPPSISVESRAAGDEAWRRWLGDIPGIESLLPALLDRLRTAVEIDAKSEERLQTAKLESLKEFAYGAGHELNNPLANIATRAQTLLAEETHPERRRRLAAINTQAFRAHEMIADMMLFARPPKMAPESVDLVALAKEVLAELADEAADQQTTLHPPGRQESLIIQADPIQLRVALRALCMNSLQAVARGGNIIVEIEPSHSPPLPFSESPSRNSVAQEFASITISDDGPGIPADILPKIFDPFFSGREAGRGLGFGLAKCWRIVTLHGGQIIAHSQPGQGASFTITLPVSQG
jgi:signal transduction histidine kinase